MSYGFVFSFLVLIERGGLFFLLGGAFLREGRDVLGNDCTLIFMPGQLLNPNSHLRRDPSGYEQRLYDPGRLIRLRLSRRRQRVRRKDFTLE
jgi:hypothetical protein